MVWVCLLLEHLLNFAAFDSFMEKNQIFWDFLDFDCRKKPRFINHIFIRGTTFVRRRNSQNFQTSTLFLEKSNIYSMVQLFSQLERTIFSLILFMYSIPHICAVLYYIFWDCWSRGESSYLDFLSTIIEPFMVAKDSSFVLPCITCSIAFHPFLWKDLKGDVLFITTLASISMLVTYCHLTECIPTKI